MPFQAEDFCNQTVREEEMEKAIRGKHLTFGISLSCVLWAWGFEDSAWLPKLDENTPSSGAPSSPTPGSCLGDRHKEGGIEMRVKVARAATTSRASPSLALVAGNKVLLYCKLLPPYASLRTKNMLLTVSGDEKRDIYIVEDISHKFFLIICWGSTEMYRGS